MFHVRGKVRSWIGESSKDPLDAFEGWNEVRPTFEGVDISHTDLAVLLSNERRCLLIAMTSFASTGNDNLLAEFDDMAEQVARHEKARDRGIPPQEVESVSDERVKRVRESLKRKHIPRLSKYDILEHTDLEIDGEDWEFVESGDNFRPALYALNSLGEYANSEVEGI